MNPRHCGHNWKPIHSWSGRYRCKWCEAIGYRKVVQPKYVSWRKSTGHHIVTYICKVSGCDSPAQIKYKQRQVCFEHRGDR
jgi:hypothetical protein